MTLSFGLEAKWRFAVMSSAIEVDSIYQDEISRLRRNLLALPMRQVQCEADNTSVSTS